MKNLIDKNTRNRPRLKLIPFRIGTNARDWDQVANQINCYFQDQKDRKESDREKEKQVEYGTEKQYWN